MEVVCVLIPDSLLSDPVGAAEATELLIGRLEGMGAEVESERPGEAFFALDGLRGIHGGDSDGVLRATRAVAGAEARLGTGPTRFAAWLGASERRSPVSVAALRERIGLPRREAGDLVETLRRLGVETLEALAVLPADRVADRFGRPGLRALRLARGEDSPLRPRRPREELSEEVELPEGAAGGQLERALGLLVDRLLAAPPRRGRTVLGLRLGALLAAGGSWSVEQGLGRPTASARVLRSVLSRHLEALPGPAATLRLHAIGLGPPAGEQLELSLRGDEDRRRRLGAAMHEVRAAQGGDALLQVLPLDSASRFPERRAILTPAAVR